MTDSALRVHRPSMAFAPPVATALSALAAAIAGQVETEAAADAEPVAPAAPDPRLDQVIERLDRIAALMESLVAEAKATHQATARIAPPRGGVRLTLTEVGKRLGKGYRTVTRLRSRGKLPDPLLMVGREWQYAADEIDDWIVAGCPDAATWRTMRGGSRPP